MKFLRVATLVIAFLGLQFALVGTGVACPAVARATSGASSAGAPVGAMVGMMMATAAGGQGAAAHAPSPTKPPCDESGAPRSCQTPASCATAIAATAADHARSAVPAASVPALTVLAPASLALAPELPPPRA